MRLPRVIVSLVFFLVLLSASSVSHALTVTVAGCSVRSAQTQVTGTVTAVATIGTPDLRATLTFSDPQNFATLPQCIRTAGGNVYLIRSGSGKSWSISQPAVTTESGVPFTLLTTFMVSRTASSTDIDPTTGLPFIDLSTVPLATPDFTITCLLCVLGSTPLPARALLDSSGSVDKVLLDNVIISVDPTVPCAGGSPCAPLQIQVRSDGSDFAALPAGGYSGGVRMSGTFFGTITNDTVSAAALGNDDVVNLTSPGPSDTQNSVPASCSGGPACVFTAASGRSSVPNGDTALDEVVQLGCPVGSTSCSPSLGFFLNITFANAGDSFDPTHIGIGQGTKPDPTTFSFAGSFAAFSAEVDIGTLAVQVKSKFTLNSKSSFACQPTPQPGCPINATMNEIGLTIGPFDTTIPAGQFVKTGSSSYTFQGTRDGVTLDAVLKLVSGNDYVFNVQGQGSPLAGLAHPVPFLLRINNDRGRTLN